MLMIDDNMYRLAKMQESLLKVSKADRRYHLDNYVKNVTELDKSVFESLVSIMKDASMYNHTLEDELAYLEKVRQAYDQVVELQTRFRTVCEQYDEHNLKLSDLSELKIEYVDSRINAINGYLVNIENINKNKVKLEALNEELVNEEKKRDFLSKRIIVLERKLKDDFVRAQVKQVVFGKLESFDIISEYDEIGFDVRKLVDGLDSIDEKMKFVESQLNEISEKYETAKVCYNNSYHDDNTRIMEDIEREYYAAKYKHVMLEIVKLLSQDVDRYDLAKEKREKFVELLYSRRECLGKIGVNNPLNILQLVDMDSQIEEINTLAENVQKIYSIRKEISDLSSRTEEMINQNNDYLISLSDTKELIESKVSLNDFDITTFDDMLDEEMEDEEMPLSNQVVKVKSVSSSFKLNIAKQKANGVIARVCRINGKEPKDTKIVKSKEEYTPELIIGPKEVMNNQDKGDKVVETMDESIFSLEKTVELKNNMKYSEPVFENNNTDEIQVLDTVDVPVTVVINDEEKKVDNQIVRTEESLINEDIFENTVPFTAPVLFTDRADNEDMISEKNLVVSEKVNIPNPMVIPEAKEETVAISDTSISSLSDGPLSENTPAEALMPDAFWVTDTATAQKVIEEEKNEISFDEQINALLAENNHAELVKRR